MSLSTKYPAKVVETVQIKKLYSKNILKKLIFELKKIKINKYYLKFY